jgi:lipid II:glycine glycyltransferase (peptidoglycan interpeptide bridge formation enzyme)
MNDDTWEQRQAELGGHFLQSAAWGKFQEALGKRVVRQNGEDWSSQGLETRGRGGVKYLYSPYGPTVKAAAGLEQAVGEWKRNEAGLDFVRCEPMGEVSADELQRLGLSRVKEWQPAHTLVVDLSLSEEDLRHGIDSGHRNAINTAEQRDLSFREGQGPADFEAFLLFIHETAVRTGFRPQSDDYLRKIMQILGPLGAAKLFVAEHDGKAAGAAIAFDYKGTRAYAHAASHPDARKLRLGAPLVWYMMMDAKAVGMSSFDLWGVAPADAPPDHPWAGFSQFKRAFGGTEREYAGTWELPLKPLKYKAYQAAKKVLRRAD